MARIRQLEIANFRGIKDLLWYPAPGINCLIGPGDSGKSSVLDAIELCLTARRNVQLTDADFYNLDTAMSIQISVTIGELNDAEKNIDSYGLFVRGFDSTNSSVVDEPEKLLEDVLTVRLSVSDDLEPSWSLFSERAAKQGYTRGLAWSDRVRLSPTRIGAFSENHFGWRRGSILSRLSETRPDASAALLAAAREARSAFGDKAGKEVEDVLNLVTKTAAELGVPVDGATRALLDAESVSFTSGTISLHDSLGVPLGNLGVGSARLLVAGLQRAAAESSNVVLLDELEYGLEPHRISRLLDSLGAKTNPPPLQAFVTTHSAAALRELSGNQLHVVRKGQKHNISLVGEAEDVQSTIRRNPEAFLARSIVVCEGASEVGLIRGIDHYRSDKGENALGAFGVALVDGGGVDSMYKRVSGFQSLGYRVAVLRDSDVDPDEDDEKKFMEQRGNLFHWRPGHSSEEELFLSLSTTAIGFAVETAVSIHGNELIDAHIRSTSGNALSLDSVIAELATGIVSEATRKILGKSAKRKAGWYKSVTWMEDLAYRVVAPSLADAEAGFQGIVADLFSWCADAGRP